MIFENITLSLVSLLFVLILLVFRLYMNKSHSIFGENNFNPKKREIIYLFYWSLTNSFDMNKMKEVKYMRKDPACLLSRVLYEISSTVCIKVSENELKEFSAVVSEAKEEKSNQSKKSKRKRHKIRCVIEETKENHIVCKKGFETIVSELDYNSNTYSYNSIPLIESTNPVQLADAVTASLDKLKSVLIPSYTIPISGGVKSIVKPSLETIVDWYPAIS